MAPIVVWIFLMAALSHLAYCLWLQALSRRINEMMRMKDLPIIKLDTPVKTTFGCFIRFRILPYSLDEDYSDKEILLLSKRYDRLLRIFYIALCLLIVIIIAFICLLR